MKRWYVVRSKPRNEVLLWHQLCSRGIEAYFPRIHPQGMVAPLGVVKPLFPGYMFVRVELGASTRSALLWMPGADGFVCFGGKPAFVADSVLRGIMECAARINKMLQGASPEAHDGTCIRSEYESFTGHSTLFDPRRSDRERSTAFLRFLRNQQMRAQFLAAPRKLGGDCGASDPAVLGFGVRSGFRNALRWHADSGSQYGEGIRLEARREEGSISS